MLIECPSGLTFQARSWKVGDRRHLHDRKILRSGLLMRKMLEAVDEGIENPGPYPFEPGKKVNWAKVCLTDIIDALIDIRKATRPQLDYNEQCENCGAKIELTVDLTGLEVDEISSEGKQHLSTGNPVMRELRISEDDPDKTVQVQLRMLLGEDMTHISKLMRQDPADVPVAQMVMHVAAILPEGKELIEKFERVRDFYNDQDWCFHEALEGAINDFGGGTNTTVEMFCKRCNAEQEGVIPFGVEFFYPQKSTKRSSLATL